VYYANGVSQLRLDHLNISVTDLDASISWYSSLFGFTVVEKGELDDGIRWAIIRSDNAMLAMYEHSEYELADESSLKSSKLHSLSHFGIAIDEPDAWLAKAEANGVEILYGGVVKWPHSRAWYVKDPTGWEIEVVMWDEGVIAFDKLQ